MNTDKDVNDSADLEARIRARAHEIWEHEGRPAGRADLHWEQARREIEFESARPSSGERPAAVDASNRSRPRMRKRA